MAKYFLATILFLFGAVLIPSLAFAADVKFTQDTKLDFPNVSPTIYVASSSECDSLTVSTSTLNVDVPAGSTFTLKTANYTVLGLTPSGGTTTLAFDTSYFSAGYVSQWTASSSLPSATVSFSVGGLSPDYWYLVKVNNVDLGSYLSNSSGLMTFNYTGGFSAKTFTISQQAPLGSGGLIVDVSAPAISQITVSVGKTEATISWKTDESSISWILYGTTTAYGLEKKTTTYVTSHSLTLTDLSASTTYHYQIKSKDSSGNIGSYTDQTFTTLAVEIVEVAPPKPIEEMTIAELQAEIARITALIAQLQAQLAELLVPAIEGVPADFTFERDLKYGQVSNDVKYLQIVLNSDPETRLTISGVGSPGKETNYFGPLTKAAVIKFQEKYASEILASWGLTKGTGLVGKTTRAKLNQLLGK